VLDERTVPLVVKHRIAGFRLLAKANAALAFSATRATCSGFRAAFDAGGQSLASAPRAKPSSSFSTATKKYFRSLSTRERTVLKFASRVRKNVKKSRLIAVELYDGKTTSLENLILIEEKKRKYVEKINLLLLFTRNYDL